MTQLIFTEVVLRRAEEVLARHPELPISSRETLDAIRASSSIECFARACEHYADRVCFTSAAGTVTYGELWERVARFATCLPRGERVGICGAPGIEWVVADLACLHAGAVSIPLAVTAPAAELRELARHAGVTTVICDASVRATFAGTSCVAFTELDAARTMPASPVIARDDDLVTVMYSSGTTGRPKGVMLTERRWRAHLHNALAWPPFPHVWVGYLPHAQIAGRRLVLEPMMHGGVTHFSPTSLPFDQLRRAQPTIVPLLPRVSAMIYQQFQGELVARFGTHDIALDDARAQHVMAGLRASYATDRLCLIRVGSGSTAPAILEFLARCFRVPVADGYGTTETGAIAINGTVFPHIEYKLVEVPELGYAASDRRGELLVRSPENTVGYLNDAGATAALFDDDGFVKTGDLVEERAPRQLVWLDRRGSVGKLAQGHFVATAQLEQLYASESPFIEQIYLHADPRRAYLLAVVVPSRTASRRIVREELDRIAREAGRPSHEVPRDFLLETEPFTVANERLTESGKQSQRRLHARYAAALDELHALLEARQLATGSLDDPQLDLATRVRAALAIALGLCTADLEAAPDLGFAGFGGDSLGALRFCTLVEDKLGVRISAGSVLDPTASLQALVAKIAGRERAIAFEDVHRHADARVEELARLVPTESRIAAAPGPPRTVLLTGASGFLGRFVLLELAKRVAEVICIVRGGDDRAASVRVREGFCDAGLAARYDQLVAGGRILVHAGDLIRPELGLSGRDHDRLCERVDAIVHGGAHVNHALSYRHLFEPNVLGTREVMRIAARRRAPIHLVSSIGVAMQPARAVDDERPGAGYVTSKWACEALLEALHARDGVPVRIVRCGNVAPHREHVCALNWADNTNRLLYSLLATRLAPTSFGSARYDLVPLDAVATAIASSATVGVSGFATHHVSNTDLSLDSLVDWTESAGYRLARLPHAQWFPAFRAQLEQLPPACRARSALAAIERWQTPLDRDHTADTTAPPVDEDLVHRWIRALADGDQLLRA